jgi:predicted Fe-S protein YdhL (DUF1289 family)
MMQPTSPCTGVCRIDPASFLCLGCARTADEIGAWSSATETERDVVWAALPARRERLGIGMHRLRWTPADIAGFVAGTFKPGSGTWTTGLHGAVAEFGIGAGEAVTLDVEPGAVTAITARGAMRFRLPPGIRALGYGTAANPAVVALALPTGTVTASAPSGLTCLGPDTSAIEARARHETLYDLGLGRAAGQFCIRTASADLRHALDGQLGRPWRELLSAVGALLVKASPTRIVTSPIGRVEVFAPIPSPDGASPPGPHTHLLPRELAEGGDIRPGGLPLDGYLPCAIHYPAAD